MVATASDAGSWARVTTGQTPYYVFTKPIEKSPQDDRDYRLIRLENGLQAMLVHHAKADKAAASLDVAVGHLYDPVSVAPCPPGMMHGWQCRIALNRNVVVGRNEAIIVLTSMHYRMTCPASRTSANIFCSWCVTS